MADEEENNIYKKKILEEEGEEDDSVSKGNKDIKDGAKIKIDFSESENNNESNSNGSNEENESEEEDSNESDESNKKKSKNKKKNASPVKRSREDYIAHIEELKNELTLEKNINNKLEDNDNFDEYKKLRKDLDKKENILKILKITSQKQKSALIKLKKELDNINEKEKENEDKYSIKEGETFLKLGDKKIIRAIYRMNILKKENEKMKNILYQNEDYNIQIHLEDKTKNNNDKIEEKIKEKNIIIKQLEQHQLCIKEREEYNHEYNELKMESKKLKKEIQDIQIKIDEYIKNNSYKIKPNLFVRKNNNLNINLIKNKFNSISTPNINKNQINQVKNKKNVRNNRTIELPLIYSNSMISKNKSTINNNFNRKLKEFLDGDEDQYMTLMNKINNIDNNKKIMESKYLNEIHKYNTKINILGDKYKYLNCNSKESNNSLILLKYRINLIKKENKKQLKKLNELKKELKEKEDICKQKNIEISSLLTEINSIKNTVRNDDFKSTKSEITKYIKKIKKQRGIIETSSKENNENEIEKNNDENIQVDFSDNEEYDNEE